MEDPDEINPKDILHFDLISGDSQTLEDDTVCCICYAEFLDVEDLNTHFSQVHLNERRKLRYCTICKKIYSDISQYSNHLKNDHLNTLHGCKYCYRLFTTDGLKNKHEKKHYSSDGIKCSQCDTYYVNVVDLTEHEFENHRDSEGIMINHCLDILSSLLCMNTWKFLKGYNENVKYCCMSCSFSTYDMGYYLAHLKNKSCNCRFSCETCYNSYSSKKSLCNHPCHGKYFNSESKCDKCKKTFNYKDIAIHQQSCSLVQCEPCDLKFDSMKELSQHNINLHQGAATVQQCTLCHRHIIGSEVLKNHMRKVHKSKLHLYKYKCVYCDRLFMHPKQLFGHFFTIHKDLQPYTCKICNLKFRLRKKFTLHVKVTHGCKGFVEFDKDYNVFFTEKKSENPFKPISFYSNQSSEESEKESNIYNKKKKTKKLKVQKIINVSEEEAICASNVTDIDNTETDTKVRTFKSKLRSKRKSKIEISDTSDEDDMPLLKVRKIKKIEARRINKGKKKKLICPHCNKYCYTLLNYEHHISLHNKGVVKRCIKCNQSFKRKSILDRHMAEKHSSSTLIDTLKKVLERRNNEPKPIKERPYQKFMKSLKKVESVPSDTQATVTLVMSDAKESVRKFLENFIPDKPERIKVKDSITIKLSKEQRTPFIKMHKYNNKEIVPSGLKMPLRFHSSENNDHKATITIYNGQLERANLNYGEKLCNIYYTPDEDFADEHSYCNNEYVEDYIDNTQFVMAQDEHVVENEEPIPEVAEEILLDSEENPTQSFEIQKPTFDIHKRTFEIQNIPRNIETSTMSYKIKIGTLIPEAPFYKICTVDEILKSQEKVEEVEDENKFVTLPDGTQLMQVNPLEHLIDRSTSSKLKSAPKQTKKRDILDAINKSFEPPKRKKLKY